MVPNDTKLETQTREEIDANQGVEESLKAAKPRAVLQMASGSGKTYTAVYRQAEFAKIKHVLFLVDRGNLATSAKDEFEQFDVPVVERKVISVEFVRMKSEIDVQLKIAEKTKQSVLVSAFSGVLTQ